MGEENKTVRPERVAGNREPPRLRKRDWKASSKKITMRNPRSDHWVTISRV